MFDPTLVIGHLSSYKKDSCFSLCNYVPVLMQESEKKGESAPLYGKSEDFDELKQKAVQLLVQQLLEMHKNLGMKNIVDSSNFNTILQSAAKLRHDIAVKTKTPDAEDFGTSTENLSPTAYQSTTLYAAQYKRVNEKIKALILNSFPKIKNRAKGICVTEGVSRYTFRLVRDEGPETFLAALSHSDYNRTHEICFSMMLVDEYKNKMKPLLNIIKGIQHTKEEEINYCLFPDRNIYIYSGRIEIQANNEWRTLTRHYAIIGCNDAGEIQEENIKDFQLHGFITLLHTNHQDFNLHQPPIEELFNKILNAKTTKEDRLVAMREFEYRFQHMIYYKRGGQAIAEMVIEALKSAFVPEYKIKGHLEALAEPFLNGYMKT